MTGGLSKRTTLTACAFSGGSAGMPLAAAFAPAAFAPAAFASAGLDSAGLVAAGFSPFFAPADFAASGVAAGADAFAMSGVGEASAEAACA